MITQSRKITDDTGRELQLKISRIQVLDDRTGLTVSYYRCKLFGAAGINAGGTTPHLAYFRYVRAFYAQSQFK